MNVVEQLSKVRIVPVLVFHSPDEARQVGKILSEEGLLAAEVTFRSAAAEESIRLLSREYPDLFIGAGTVLNVADLDRAFKAGAKFAVAPGFNPTVVKAATAKGYAFAPGICTPSEIEQAYELGCKFLKFFPAGAAGGTPMLKSIAAPYKHLGLRFMPTGGVSAANAAEYLSLPEVAAVGGTWLAKSDELAAGNWDAVRAKVRAAVELVKKL